MSDRGLIPQGLTQCKGLRPWPDAPLSEIPGDEEAAKLAATVRERALGAADINAPLQDFGPFLGDGVRISRRRLAAAGGGDEAMLLARPGGFHILVDSEPRGGWPDSGHSTDTERHRFRFRVAHELAHTVFYDRRWDTPRRRLGNSELQEAFADAFARALLVPPAVAGTSEPTPRGVRELQQRFDVSLEVAARAVAAAHPQVECVALFYWKSDEAVSPENAHLQWTSRPSMSFGGPKFSDLFKGAISDSQGVEGAGVARGRALFLPKRRQLIYVSCKLSAIDL